MQAARLSIALLITSSLGTTAFAQAQQSLDQREMVQAEVLSGQGKYEEALAAYQAIEKKYLSSPLIPAATLGAAVNLYFLKRYDESAQEVRKNFAKPNVPADVLERSYVLLPQILSTKASEMPLTEGEARKTTFQEAIKGFEEFMTKFPRSPEVETALYGKGRALASIEDFEGAAAILKEAIDKYPRSPTILDTKFLRGLSLAQQGIKASANGASTPASKAALDEAEKTFREIIPGTDLALTNSSYMQLGDVYTINASLAGKDEEAAKKFNQQALDQYRSMHPKDVVAAVQERRIAYYLQLAEQARSANPARLEEWRMYGRVAEKEREKLATIKDQPDQSLEAKLKAGQIFLALAKYDEARVMLKFTEGFLTDEDKDQKKRISYFLAVTYAAQHVADKAVAAYKKFQDEFGKSDPIAENLALLVGAIFLDPDKEINNPDEAIKYFGEQIANYPKSKFTTDAILQQASALVALKRFDEGLKSLDEALKSQTDKDLLVQGEYLRATIQRELGQNEEAIKTFKEVRDKYPGTEQAQQAAFWCGQIAAMVGDTTTALAELNSFIEKFPESELMANALYFKARAQAQSDDRDGAIATYTDLGQRFSDAESAPPAMLEMAGILQRKADDATGGNSDVKPDYSKVHAVIEEFTQKYPNNERIFQAYDFDAQLSVKEKDEEKAIAKYEEFLSKHADKPDVAVAHLKLANIWKKRAEDLGPFLALNQADQTKWKEWMDKAMKNAEDGIQKAPEHNAVSQLLDLQLKIESLRMLVGQKKADEVKAYFTGLAGKFEGKTTGQKILVAFANFLAENDREKKGDWFDIMDKNVDLDGNLVFAPSDLDRYGNALVDRKQFDKAKKVVAKLRKDYPVPEGTDPSKVTRSVGEAQSTAMAMEARILQAESKATEAAAILANLKKLYPWSSKVMEANYGIGMGLYQEKKYDEALEVFGEVAKANTGAVKIRAQSMMTSAKILEEQKKYGEAINNYVKIAAFFESERDIAAEGLWRGAQLMEDQATGKIPMPKPATPDPTATKKTGAGKPAGQSGAKPAGKPGEAKPAGKPGEAKPAAKPGKPGEAKPAAKPKAATAQK